MIGATLLMVGAVVMGATHREHASSVPYFRSAEMTPEWLADRDAARPTTHRVAAFSALNQAGNPVTSEALKDRVTIVQFFFATCGDVCPTTTSNIARLLRELPDAPDMQALSFTVTPERDSVGALRMYASMRGIHDARWALLTMPKEATDRFARESFFLKLGDGSTFGVKSVPHTESVMLVDGDGRIRGIYAGTLALEMQKRRDDILTLRRDQQRAPLHESAGPGGE